MLNGGDYYILKQTGMAMIKKSIINSNVFIQYSSSWWWRLDNDANYNCAHNIFNPLTAGVEYIRVLFFLLTR